MTRKTFTWIFFQSFVNQQESHLEVVLENLLFVSMGNEKRVSEIQNKLFS